MRIVCLNMRISNALQRCMLVLMLSLLSNFSINGQSIKADIQQLMDSLELIQYTPQKIRVHKEKTFKISVKNQADFDTLNEKIIKAIKSHWNIQVNISKGVYYYKEDHLALTGDMPNINISIKGNRVTLIGAGRDFSPNDKYRGVFSPHNIFVDINTAKVYDFWDSLVRADSLIKVVDKDKKICRIPYSKVDDISESDCKLLYIRITQWFRSGVYKVLKIEAGNIFFIADNLHYLTAYARKEYNVNYDYIYGNQTPRFSMCNPMDLRKMVSFNDDTVNTSLQSIHECQTSRFLSIENLFCSSFSLTGIRFVGNSVESELIGINNSNFRKCTISNCSFESVQSTVIRIKDSENVCIEKNSFSRLYNYGIQVANGSSNIEIMDNTFCDCGLALTNSFCVQCAAENYYIANNTFRNFGYGAIGIGVYHEDEKTNLCTGIIEYNEMYYDSLYCAAKKKNTLMDSGAIYIWTQNDDAIIRNNFIHDIVGMRDNRGIFCDDGARNFKLYGNIIVNTPNGYSIDSYRKADQRQGFGNNTNNMVVFNLVDHSIRFEGRNQVNNGCVKAYNLICNIALNGNVDYFDQIERMEDDFQISDFYLKKGRVYVDKQAFCRVSDKSFLRKIGRISVLE